VSDLHVVDTGFPDGPVVVWLASLGATTAMWERQIAVLGHRCRCVLVDHPGHGASPTLPGPYTIDGLGDAIVATIDRLGIERARIVGLSIGAMMAMAIGVRHPERVERLALLCTSAQLGPASSWHERAATVRADGPAAIARTVVGRWLTPASAAAHPDEVEQLVAMVSSVEREAYASCCEAIAAMDLRSELPSISAPTLVVAATMDPATPIEHGELIASLIPGARIEIIEAAHLASWERADDVNALLAEHLLWDRQP
jgi:3-oxoadipate enol-lactonase